MSALTGDEAITVVNDALAKMVKELREPKDPIKNMLADAFEQFMHKIEYEYHWACLS